jgi:exopolysaccharide production protein ExoQ
MTFSLWIPTVWMLYIASRPLGLWFGNDGDPNEGSPLDRNLLILLLLIGLLLLIKRRFNFSRAIRENILLMVLIGFMLISILWSDFPFMSFKRWIRELVAVVMAFLCLTERNPRKAVESVIRRTIYICIPFSLLLIKYFPLYGVQYHWYSGTQSWIGVTMQKNGLGRLCLIAAFFIVWTFIRRRQVRDNSAVKYQTYAEIVVLIITLWLMKGPGITAMSATAVTSLSAGVAAFGYLWWMKKRTIHMGAITLIAVIAACIILGTVVVFTGGSTIGSFTSSVGRDATLTGRTEIWAELLPLAMLRPIVGHGVGGFWSPEAKEKHNLTEAHSGYLEIILDYGLVGLLLFSLFLLSSCLKAHRELKHDFYWGSLLICFLLMSVIHNISESSLSSFTSHLTAVLLFLAVSSAVSTRYKPGFVRKSW